MNTMRFKELWDDGHPGQQMVEYFQFLNFAWNYFDLNRVITPVVLEIGVRRNRQKKFYRNILLASHIGVDISDRYGKVDVVGDSHDSETFRRVQEKLQKHPGGVDLLFIDGDHTYKGVKHDFFKYRPLVKKGGLIAIHDIHCLRCDVQVDQFWNDLRKNAIKLGTDETFIEFFKPQPPDHYGIGVVINGPGPRIMGVNDL